PEYIEAVYAVAENTEYDNNEYDYWVANVIVIEVKGQIGDVDNISLAFSNYKQTTQRVKFLDTLTTKYEGVNAHVIPDGADWGPRWEDYGFYKLYDTEKDGDELLADDIVRINRGEYNTNGIYAGVVTRVDKVSGRGGYIDVDLHDANNSSITREAVTVKDGAAYLPSSMQYIYAIDGDEAVDDLTVTSKNNGDVRTGDHIIWVTKTDDAKTTYYIVVVSDKNDNDGHNHDWTTKSWLKALYADIISEQRGTKAETVTPSVDVIVSNAIGGPKKITAENVVVKPTAEGGNWKISIANLNTAIGSIAGMSGYTADSFEITSDAKYHGEAVKSATHYEIPGVTGPVTVEVIAKGADVANAVTVTDKTGNVTELWVDGEKQTTTISGTPSGAMKAGTEIEVRFTTAADKIGYYSTTDGGAKMKAEAAGTAPDGKKIWKFTDTVRASALTYFVYGEADELYTFKTTDSTVTLSNANPMAANTDLTTLVSKVTVTAPLHYTVAVKDITIGEKKLTPTTDYTFNSANGEITFKNSLQLTGDVTIEVEKTPKTYTLTINARNFLDKIDGDTVGYTWTKDYTYTGKSMVLELTPKAGTVGLAIDIQDPANTATLANNKLTLTLEDDTTISLIAETDAAKLGRIETAVRTLTLKYESANPTASDLLSRIEMQIMDLVGKDGATVVDLVEKTGDTLA
ncbi:MAG: hypothetical protein HFF79_09160, partial [Oscillospiraceae bacterium]|nr:hypothetical protein [Oscillospiraceae bacterium]